MLRLDRFVFFVFLVFLAGLAAVCWVGAGYAVANPAASAVTLLIGACYVAGALELWRYRAANAALVQALTTLAAAPAQLDDWIGRLPARLRGAVRLRIEEGRAALPAPALTPYLVGLLVLLGMLGTLLGMVVTLRGTGAALASATDPDAIRTALAAPVRGLGFAFGTSIAGVSTSAALGLMSALCGRARIEATRQLDAARATTLRRYSRAQRQEDHFALMQQQSALMPALIDGLQTLMHTIEQRSDASHAQQIASQQTFIDSTRTAYAQLAASLGQTLQDSAAASARAAGAALAPLVETTMAHLERQTAALHDSVSHAVQRQLDSLSSGFDTSTAKLAGIWHDAQQAQQRVDEARAQHLHSTLAQFSTRFDERSGEWLARVATRLDTATGHVAQAWRDALAAQETAHAALSGRHERALNSAAATFAQHADALVHTLDDTHARLRAELAARDDERLAAWHGALDAIAATLREQWEAVGLQTARRQQDICDALARTAQDIGVHTQAQARDTIAEIERLVHAAAQAPQAAAEAIGELRARLSDSMARDAAMLEERSRLLQNVETLLGALNRASTEQRTAIDALVTTSADLLSRAGSQFSAQLEREADRLASVSAQVAGGAAEVASLGDTFGAAVQRFGASNDALVAQLQRIESALDKSAARSDEQLAYYVAQARDVIDLSLRAQQQIIEELQQLAGTRAIDGAQPA
jgi:hypothetical protein